jgi:hypothetical protein
MPRELVTTEALLLELKELLQTSLGSISSRQAFVGFDGFIDTIQKPIGSEAAKALATLAPSTTLPNIFVN